MGARARLLSAADVARVTRFCEQDPVANLGLLARLSTISFGARYAGGIYGFERGGRLNGVCFIGGNVIVSTDDADAIGAFADQCSHARVNSILGRADAVLAMHDNLAGRWGRLWATPRNIRRCQPLMVWTGPAQVAPEPSVRLLAEAEFPSYFDASVRMYTEEIGVSPLAAGPGYEDAVRGRLTRGHAYGVVRNGRVLFKADLGVTYGDRAQIQGVWLDPTLRGRGLAAPAMAAVLERCRGEYPNVSLYVNDFNLPAIRAYERCGFVRVGTMATVHY